MGDSFKLDDSRYIPFYKPNDLYWGIGIENETYFQATGNKKYSGSYLKSHRARERYSVDYNLTYDQGQLNPYLNYMFPDNDLFEIPLLVNSHTFSRGDRHLEPITKYEKNTPSNPLFNGRTVHQELMDWDPIFKVDYGHRYTFDGDSIEFITQNFYKTTVADSVGELADYKQTFLSKVNDFVASTHFHAYPNLPSTLKFPKFNYGLAQFGTNRTNVALFNNGTYHINLTMPTQLNAESQIEDPIKFRATHQNAIKILQWMEPFLIALYGSPDVYGFGSDGLYVNGSLRLNTSRYIGVGTFDTEKMIEGKQLNDKKEEMKIFQMEKSWYNQIHHENGAYVAGDKIGYDVNYHKHYNAGIEFRILDWFPEEYLEGLINFMILLLDHSLNVDIQLNAIDSEIWNNFVVDALKNGWLAEMNFEIQVELHKALKFPIFHTTDLQIYLQQLISYLYGSYAENGLCSSHMSPWMKKPTLSNVNQLMWEANFLRYIPTNNPKHPKVKALFAVIDGGEVVTMDQIRLQELVHRYGLEFDNIKDLHSKLVSLNSE